VQEEVDAVGPGTEIVDVDDIAAFFGREGRGGVGGDKVTELGCLTSELTV
jgi:hypothetical protein